MHVAQELVASLETLVSLPTIYYRVRHALDKPDLAIGEVAELMGTDPALSAGLLRLANSAMFGRPRRVESIQQALTLIGLKQAGDLVLTTSIAATFGGIRPQRMDMTRFWRTSVRCALLCRRLAAIRQPVQGDRLFLLGLLADMGHLVMYQAIPDLCDVVMETGESSLRARAAREREIIGCDFAEVGAALASAWRLPLLIGVTLGAQLRPEQAGEFATHAALLNVARSIDEAIETENNWVPAVDVEALSLSGVPAEDLPPAVDAAEEALQGMLESLQLPLR